MENYINTDIPFNTSSTRQSKPPLPKRYLPYLPEGGTSRRVLRQEHKYAIAQMQLLQYRARITKIMQADKNNGADGYMVRSLYFDTLNDYDYRTKIDGVDMRRKIRLRIYSTKSEYASLEIKQKQSIYQLKRSIRIKREDAEQMCGGNYTPLLYYDDAFALECYALMNARGYLPKAIVQYQRTAFVGTGNDIRITFDSQIRATESCMDLFSDRLCLYPAANPLSAVLEVKYNSFLFSYIKDLLQGLEKSGVAVSKYCMARAISMGMDY